MTLTPKNLKDLIVPQYLLITVFSTLAAFFIILGNLTSLIVLIPIMLSISLVVLALNALNQVYDTEIDKISKPERPIPSKRVTKLEGKLISILFYFTAFIISFAVNHLFVYIIFIYIIISILYSIPPLRLRQLPFSSLIFGSLFHGVIPFVSVWAISQSAFPYAFFFFFLFIGIIMSSTKDFEDVKSDATFGIKNFCTVFGIQNTIKFILVAYFLLILFMLYLSFISVIDTKYVVSSVFALFLLVLLANKYKTPLLEENVITQSKLVTYGMVISILIQLSYGFVSIIF